MVGDALELAALCLRVFPLHRMDGQNCTCGRDCMSPGKHPRTPNGCKDATLDEHIIRLWFTSTGSNLGVATGEGLYVIDLDGDQGEASWMLLDLPEPEMRARTGSGGRHLYYGIPLGDTLPNTAGKLGAGIDTRGKGGYVVAPPSNHRSGGTYEWTTSSRALTPLPDEIRALLTPTIATPPTRPRITDATSSYGAGVLTNAMARIAAAAEGTRNQALNDEAFLVGQFVGGGEIDPCGVEHLLAEACAGPDKKKNTATVRRALHDGMQHGRRAPEGDD